MAPGALGRKSGLHVPPAAPPRFRLCSPGFGHPTCWHVLSLCTDAGPCAPAGLLRLVQPFLAFTVPSDLPVLGAPRAVASTPSSCSQESPHPPCVALAARSWRVRACPPLGQWAV